MLFGKQNDAIFKSKSSPADKSMFPIRSTNQTFVFPKHQIELNYVEDEDTDTCEIGSEEGIRRAYRGALRELGHLIQEAEKSKGLMQRRIRRSKALATRPCCHLECTAIAYYGEEIPKHLCAACRKQHYCSVVCQKVCWKEHKLVCSALIKDT